MRIAGSFIRGLAFGLEYVDLEEEDAPIFGNGATIMIMLSLGIFRLVYTNGVYEDEDNY